MFGNPQAVMLKKKEALNSLKVTILFLERESWWQRHIPSDPNPGAPILQYAVLSGGNPMEFLSLWQAVSWKHLLSGGLQNQVKNGTTLSLCNEENLWGRSYGNFLRKYFFCLLFSWYLLALRSIPGIEIESIFSHRSSQTSGGDWQVGMWILIQAEGCKGRGVWREPGKLREDLNPCQTQAFTRWYSHTLGHSSLKVSWSTWSLLLTFFFFFFLTFWLLKSEQPQNDHPASTLISPNSCNPLMFGKWIENEAIWLDFCIFSINIKYSFPGAFETLHCFILKVIKISRNLICIIFILLNKHDLKM